MQNIISLIRNKRNLLILGVIFASLGYVFSIMLTSIGVILLLTFWLLNATEINLRLFAKKNVLHLLVAFFAMLLIGFTYSQDLQQAQKDIVRHLSFVLLPLVFTTIKPLDKKEYQLVIRTFIYTTTIFFLICLFNAIWRQVVFSGQGGHFNWYFFYRYDFLEIFKQHPTYVSMYVLLSISFILDKGNVLFRRNWLRISLILVQVLAMVLFGSRIAYVILMILFSIYAIKSLRSKSKAKKRKLIIIYFTLVISLLIVSWNIPIVKERILFTIGHKQDYRFNNEEVLEYGSPEEQGRLLLWKDVLELIKEKPIFGHGTGSNYVVLGQKYKEKNHKLFLEKRYNAHNTYLEVLLVGGIPLLLIYLTLLGVLLHRAINKKDFTLLSFFMIISITGLTETVFRSQGIVFFALFYCLLLSDRKNE